MLPWQARDFRPIEWIPRDCGLTIEERKEILSGTKSWLFTFITLLVNYFVPRPLLSREVGANGGRNGYRIWPAHCRARERAKRPKAKKLSYEPLAKQVTQDLRKLWSPEEISLYLRLDFPIVTPYANTPRDHLAVHLRTG